MRTRSMIAAILVVVGVVWTAQGLGLLRGSGFMDGDVRWAAAGIVLVVLGLAAGVMALRRRPGA